MLFFFVNTINKICSSLNRVVLFTLFVLFICCILPSIINAYPSSLSNLNNNNFKHQRWIISNEKNLQRNERGTGFYIIRQGDYLVLVPDSKHHFTKNMRPYIGRRR